MESILHAVEKIDKDEVYDHIAELYSEKELENQDLGYVDRTKDTITINLPISDIDLEIKQSLSQLVSNTSSTGFVCWRSSKLLVDWILSDKRCPFYLYFVKPTTDVLELGSGIGGICASTLGPRSLRFVSSDQRDLLKLLRYNIDRNCSMNGMKTDSIRVIELDWEYPEHGIQNYYETTSEGNLPDFIIGCDTIYNEYLIDHYLKTLKLLMSSTTIGILAVQLRDSITLESFVQLTVDFGFNIYIVNDSYLSSDLKRGYVVYCIELDTQ